MKLRTTILTLTTLALSIVGVGAIAPAASAAQGLGPADEWNPYSFQPLAEAAWTAEGGLVRFDVVLNPSAQVPDRGVFLEARLGIPGEPLGAAAPFAEHIALRPGVGVTSTRQVDGLLKTEGLPVLGARRVYFRVVDANGARVDWRPDGSYYMGPEDWDFEVVNTTCSASFAGFAVAGEPSGDEPGRWVISDDRARADGPVCDPVAELPVVEGMVAVDTVPAVGVPLVSEASVLVEVFDGAGRLIDSTTRAGLRSLSSAWPSDPTFMPSVLAPDRYTVRWTLTASTPGFESVVREAFFAVQVPTAVDDSTVTPAGVPVAVDVLANDVLLTTAVPLPETVHPVGAGGVSSTPDGQLEFTPSGSFTGKATFTYSGTSQAGTSATALVAVEVGEPGEPPVEDPPVENPPADPPVADPPVENPPADPPVGTPPVADPPAGPPVGTPPTTDPPADPPATDPPVTRPGATRLAETGGAPAGLAALAGVAAAAGALLIASSRRRDDSEATALSAPGKG